MNRAVLPHLRAQHSGLVIWVGSSSTRGGCPPFLAPYFGAKAIAAVVDLPAGQRPFRVHIDPSKDGCEVVAAVADRIRVDFYHRVGLESLPPVRMAHYFGEGVRPYAMVLVDEVVDGGWGRADETFTLAKMQAQQAAAGGS